ncbi:hypothetical protein TVAG_152110, partial [Trichomonas vaginalis G3]
YDGEKVLHQGVLAGRKVAIIVSTGVAPMFFDVKKGNSLDAYLWSAMYAFNYAGFTIFVLLTFTAQILQREKQCSQNFKRRSMKNSSSLINGRQLMEKGFTPILLILKKSHQKIFLRSEINYKSYS